MVNPQFLGQELGVAWLGSAPVSPEVAPSCPSLSLGVTLWPRIGLAGAVAALPEPWAEGAQKETGLGSRTSPGSQL